MTEIIESFMLLMIVLPVRPVVVSGERQDECINFAAHAGLD